MDDKQAGAQSKEIDSLIKLLETAKNDPSVLERIGQDPIGILKSKDIRVEEEFREAVISQFEAASKNARQPSPPAPPKNLSVVVEKAEQPLPPEVASALEFMVKPWGFVLAVREPAVKYIQGGGNIAAGVAGGAGALAGLGGLAAASSALGPLGITVGVIAGIIAAELAVVGGVITMMDQGKGVYLTWTWVQVLPFLNITQLPIVTPIN